MSGLLGTLSLALLAGAGFAMATSLGVAVLWPALRRRLRGRHPALRSLSALALAAAPSVLPVLLLALCFAPGLLGLVGLHSDHCVRHADHPHLCLVHPRATLTVPLALPLIGFGAALAVGAARGVRRAARTRATVLRLRLGSAREMAPGVRWVDSDRPFSVAAGGAGLGHGEIFVSRALFEALPGDQLAAVLGHERAHLRRRDGLRRAAARALSWAHLPAVRRALLDEHALATEQACDEEAALQVGDRLCVAEAILAVERLLAAAPGRPSSLLAFGGSSVPERVRSLLADPGRGGSPRLGLGLAGGLPLLVWLAADPLHHATEHLLAVLVAAL